MSTTDDGHELHELRHVDFYRDALLRGAVIVTEEDERIVSVETLGGQRTLVRTWIAKRVTS